MFHEEEAAQAIPALYERHAGAWVAVRGGDAGEGPWLDRLVAGLAPGARVLDVGCGHGKPIAAALIARGFRVTGVDVSPTLLAAAASALPEGEWIEADMRALALGRRFDAVLAWHSFFHLGMADQRAALPRLAAHLGPGAPLMWTAGLGAGVAMGEWEGEPLHHASLSRDDYTAILAHEGCAIEKVWLGHPVADGPTVYLARRQISPAKGLEGSA
jgi:SAM-dependent methyltransferase